MYGIACFFRPGGIRFGTNVRGGVDMIRYKQGLVESLGKVSGEGPLGLSGPKYQYQYQ